MRTLLFVTLTLVSAASWSAGGPFLALASNGVLEGICKGADLLDNGYTVACQAATVATEVIYADVGDQLDLNELPDWLVSSLVSWQDAGLIDDGEATKIYQYARALWAGEEFAGYLIIEGFVSSGTGVKEQVKARYNIYGELVYADYELR